MANEQVDGAAELSRIRRYLQEIASFNRRQGLGKALADPERRRVYELSDGQRSSEEIAADKHVSKSARTVRRWWKEWRDQGLVEDETTEYERHRYATFVLDVEAGEQ